MISSKKLQGNEKTVEVVDNSFEEWEQKMNDLEDKDLKS